MIEQKIGDNMYNAKNKTLTLPCGAQMYYAQFGKGEKPLVMVPGLNIIDITGSAKRLAWFYRKFAKHFTVYIFDRRSGCDKGATIKSMSDDLAAAMQTVGISNACVLGVSQGGMIVQYLAADHPELVGKLVLGVTASKTNPLMIEALDEWISFAENDDLKGVLTKSYDRMYTAKQIKKYRRVIPLMMHFTKFMSTQRFADHARAIYTLDSTDRLDRIKCPTLVIGAELDRITTAQGAEEIADRLGCRCHIFAGEGHAVYLSEPFNKMVYNYLA